MDENDWLTRILKRKRDVVELFAFLLIISVIILIVAAWSSIFIAQHITVDEKNNTKLMDEIIHRNWDLKDLFAGFISVLAIGAVIFFLSAFGASVSKDNWYSYPLGVPSGSVRALIALLFVVAVLFGSNDFKNNATIAGILGTILGFYFGDRKSKDSEGSNMLDADKKNPCQSGTSENRNIKTNLKTNMKIKFAGEQLQLENERGRVYCIGEPDSDLSNSVSDKSREYTIFLDTEEGIK